MLNKVILMGRLVRDPELRHTANNMAVCGFSLAVNRDYAPQGGQPQTDFIEIVSWNKTAEFVSKYFAKGQLVAVTGRIQTRNREDKNGNKRVSVEVVADEVHFAESKKDVAKNDPKQPQKTASFDFDDSDFGEFKEDGDLPF